MKLLNQDLGSELRRQNLETCAQIQHAAICCCSAAISLFSVAEQEESLRRKWFVQTLYVHFLAP